jgi:hypothetical protein
LGNNSSNQIQALLLHFFSARQASFDAFGKSPEKPFPKAEKPLEANFNAARDSPNNSGDSLLYSLFFYCSEVKEPFLKEISVRF